MTWFWYKKTFSNTWCFIWRTKKRQVLLAKHKKRHNMQNQFIPLSSCYMVWLLIILIFSWLFWGCSIFILNILFFVWFYWQTSLAAKKVQNDLASLQNHSTFGDKLDIIDGFALKFVMIFRQNISYFQTLLSFRHNHMQSKRVFLLLWVSKWCV